MTKPELDYRSKALAIARGLYPHQVEGVAFLMGRRRAILADDMGLGKTRQAIVAVTHEATQGPYLVVCPASVKRNWGREIGFVCPYPDICIVGPGDMPDSEWKGWVIINYDLLKRHKEALTLFPWQAIIFDEAHYLKNHRSQRSRLGRSLVEECPGKPLVYCLTGTPMMNRPRDLFVLLQVVGHSMGRSFIAYAKRYCDAFQNEYGWVTDGASNLKELALELQGVLLRRAKEDVLELPPKLRTWLDVDVPPNTAQKETEEALAILLQGQRRERDGVSGETPAGNDRGRLLAKLTTARRKLAEAKASTTIEYVQNVLDQGEKILVFSCFDAPLQKIHERFEDCSVIVTGATPVDSRQALVDRFQEDEGTRVFVANILAGGVGLNLTAASQIVFNDLDWVPANHWQAEDRAYRIGQQSRVQAAYMVAARTIDEFVERVLQAKAALVSAVIDGEGLEEAIGGDVLTELQNLMRNLSPQLSDEISEGLTAERIGVLLENAQPAYQNDKLGKSATEGDRLLPISDEAIALLVDVLRRPKSSRYEVVSSSRPDTNYELTVDGQDVVCSCPGFEYRGKCSHAGKLASALASGEDLPSGMKLVG